MGERTRSLFLRARYTSGAVFLWCLACANISAANDLLYSNGSNLTGSGIVSEKGMVDLNGTTFLIQGGDTFTLSQDATLSGIRWWGLNFGQMPGVDNSFEVTLYTIDAGTVSEVPFHTSQLTSLSKTPVAGFPGSFEYTAVMDSVVLSANTDYMLSIVNDFSTPGDLSDYWVWQRNDDGPDSVHSAKQSTTATPGPWNKDGFDNDLAFQLLGSDCLRPGCNRSFFRGWRVILAAPQEN